MSEYHLFVFYSLRSSLEILFLANQNMSLCLAVPGNWSPDVVVVVNQL